MSRLISAVAVVSVAAVSANKPQLQPTPTTTFPNGPTHEHHR